jgi:hypothetical protein
MSSPKEKAIELYNKFYNTDSHGNSVKVRESLAKQYTLLAVNEIIIALEEHMWQNRLLVLWYQEVKTEIENL